MNENSVLVVFGLIATFGSAIALILVGLGTKPKKLVRQDKGKPCGDIYVAQKSTISSYPRPKLRPQKNRNSNIEYTPNSWELSELTEVSLSDSYTSNFPENIESSNTSTYEAPSSDSYTDCSSSDSGTMSDYGSGGDFGSFG